MQTATTQRASVQEDFLIRCARIVLYIGLFATSLMVFRVASFTFGDILIVGSLFLASLSMNKSPRKVSPSTAIATLLVLIGGCLATSVAIDPGDSFLVLGRILFLALALPWLAQTVLTNRTHLINAGYAFALGAAVCGAGTLLQFTLGPGAIPGTGVTTAGRFPGFAAHVSDTGGITALAVAFAFAMAGSEAEGRRRFLTLLILAGGVVGLVLSGSVSGMLAAGVACLIIFLLRGISVRRIVMIGVAGAAAFYVSTAVLSERSTALNPIERIYQVLGISGSQASLNTTDSRWDTIEAGWEGFLAQPLTGFGLDALSSQVVDSFGVHNFAVAALYQGGIIFAFGLFILIVKALKVGSIRKDSVAVAVSGMVIAAVVFAQTAPSLYNRYFWVPLALFAVVKILPMKPPAVGISAGGTAEKGGKRKTTLHSYPLRAAHSKSLRPLPHSAVRVGREE